MEPQRPRPASKHSWVVVLLAVAVLVGAANIGAYSATGGKFILGKTNKAGDISVLKRNGSGAALKLKTKAGSPPLKVTSRKKVRRLNADMVDGRNASQLQTRSLVYTVPKQTSVSSFNLEFPNLPPGVYHADFSVVALMSTSGASLNCMFDPLNSNTNVLLAFGGTSLNYSTSNGSGVVDTRSGPYSFRCVTSSGSATTDPDTSAVSQVVLTRIDGITESSLTAARVSPRITAPGAGG